MLDSDRFRLLDTYTTPRRHIVQRVRCAVFGQVTVCGLSDAPLPWPVCLRGKWRVPIVYKGLARAVRRESRQAISYWWGVGGWSVWLWRRALRVTRNRGYDPESTSTGRRPMEPAPKLTRRTATPNAGRKSPRHSAAGRNLGTPLKRALPPAGEVRIRLRHAARCRSRTDGVGRWCRASGCGRRPRTNWCGRLQSLKRRGRRDER
jgi:hypothetical protein